jgi:hypothetical protein
MYSLFMTIDKTISDILTKDLASALVLAVGCRRRVSTPPYSLFAATDADHRAVQAG